MIRVGTIKNSNDNIILDNYKTIKIMTKSSAYGELGPYVLKDKNGRVLENIWQFSKVYEKINNHRCTYSQWDSTIIWEQEEDTHLNNGILTDSYFNWRNKGFYNEQPVRYPCGKNWGTKCKYAVPEYDMSLKLDYITSRKKLYLPIYTALVKNENKFNKIVDMLKKGTNILIIEVDGPRQESLDYYKEKYNVSDNWISERTIEANLDNLNIMLNDSKHCFGHGYCCAIALQESLGLSVPEYDKSIIPYI
jgi:hypothetical protein